MIDREHARPITRQAQLLAMSRGLVYYMARSASAAVLALMRRIDELHLEHPFMGARMLRDQLLRAGTCVGRRHIAALMKRIDLAPEKRTGSWAACSEIRVAPQRAGANAPIDGAASMEIVG